MYTYMCIPMYTLICVYWFEIHRTNFISRMQDSHRGYHRSHQKCFFCCVFPFISHQFSATLHSVHCFTTHTIQCSTLHSVYTRTRHASHTLHALHIHYTHTQSHTLHIAHALHVGQNCKEEHCHRHCSHWQLTHCIVLHVKTVQLCAWHWPTKSFSFVGQF